MAFETGKLQETDQLLPEYRVKLLKGILPRPVSTVIAIGGIL